MNKLTELIDSLVLEKTVSLEALNGINELKRQAELLEHRLKESDQTYDKCLNRIEELTAELNAKKSDILAKAGKISELETKVESMRKAEREGQDAKAELRGFVGAAQMFLRPSVVRESIQKRVPVAAEGCPPGPNGSYPTPGFVMQYEETGTIERSAE
jgi:polyhydroxyalkanoate synthesis regulator phasin